MKKIYLEEKILLLIILCLCVCVLLSCKKETLTPEPKIIVYKSATSDPYICDFEYMGQGQSNGHFQDSCHKYVIGDKLK